ncbi:MAG: hypothetical protein ACRD0K_28545 [Egibacteraceae bacterium]
MSEAALDVTVGDDGSLRVAAAELAARGVRPGDRVRVLPLAKRRIRSMLGVHARGVGFTDEHLRALRREMGEGIGEDLSR